MKLYFLLPFVLVSGMAWSQQDTGFHLIPIKHAVYETHLVMATLSVGFIDDYRNNYTMPAGYVKNNTSGFAPIYGKLEYGVGRHLSLAATFGYDAFQYNYAQTYEGNSGTFVRNRIDRTRVLSAGFTGFYHLNNLIHVRHLDPFIGLGVSINNIRYGAHPSGDTEKVVFDHTVTPYLKAGARYYITQKYSLFGDVGYDQHTVFSLGVSCRFIKNSFYPDADRDGIPDYKDSCRNEKGIARFNGCPDSDGDGIPDYADSCPHQKGLVKFFGCPDSDGDGLRDKDDSCPHEAGPLVFNGCPDSDGDGIPDKDDACPNLAGPADNNGCPRTKVEAPPAPPAEVKQVQLPKKPIQFELGSTVLKKSCYSYLDQVVAILKENPDAVINIDGYADITGKPRVNAKISKERATAVKKFLVKKGIAPARLETTGHGSSSPVASNRTRAGRAQNRRVTINLKYSLQ